MEESYQDAPQPGYEDQPESKRKVSGWVIALIFVLAVIVLCCVVVCLVGLLAPAMMGGVFSTVLETVEAMTPIP